MHDARPRPQQIKHVCGDQECVSVLAEWLGELLAERGGASEGLLVALVAQLGRMPLKAAMLKQVRVDVGAIEGFGRTVCDVLNNQKQCWGVSTLVATRIEPAGAHTTPPLPVCKPP